MNLDGAFLKVYPFLELVEGYERVRVDLLRVAATYIFFHSELKNASCSAGFIPWQKKGLGKFPSQSPTTYTLSHSSPLAEWIVEMEMYSVSFGTLHSS